MIRKCTIIAAALIASLAGCSSGGADKTTGTTGTGTGTGNGTGCTAGDGTVCVLGTSFNPVDMTISKNASVTWSEVTGVHHIVFDGPPTGATPITDIGDFSAGTVHALLRRLEPSRITAQFTVVLEPECTAILSFSRPSTRKDPGTLRLRVFFRDVGLLLLRNDDHIA
jgi:hypothetical protein